MKLSTRTQYGVRILCQLALDWEKGPLQLAEIGLREGISEKYLGQIMLLLRSSGLVSSVRGAQGGYYLSRKPELINMLEVFLVLEGEVLEFGDSHELSPGLSTGPQGRQDTSASSNMVWQRVKDCIESTLSRLRLDELAAQGRYQDGYIDFKI